MDVCVRCSLLCPLPLKTDAGEMLITPDHKAGRVHSSKAGPSAAEAQSAGMNLFRSEALQRPKADASAETPSLPLSLHALHNHHPSRVCGCECVCVGVSVCICFCKRSKMKGSCPQWLCIRRYFSLCDAAHLKATFSFLNLSVRGVLSEAILHFQNFLSSSDFLKLFALINLLVVAWDQSL